MVVAAAAAAVAGQAVGVVGVRPVEEGEGVPLLEGDDAQRVPRLVLLGLPGGEKTQV